MVNILKSRMQNSTRLLLRRKYHYTWLSAVLLTELTDHLRKLELTHTLHLDSTDKWFEYCKSGNKPDDIPANPNVVYEDEWTGWPDWLGYEERKWNIRRVKELIKDMIEHNILDDMSEDERIA